MFVPRSPKPQAMPAERSSDQLALRRATASSYDRDIEQAQTSRRMPQIASRFPDNEPPSAVWSFSKLRYTRRVGRADWSEYHPLRRRASLVQSRENSKLASLTTRSSTRPIALPNRCWLSPRMTASARRRAFSDFRDQRADGRGACERRPRPRQSGQAARAALRQDMEQRFGHDFSNVRVHSGVAAEQSAQDVDANAYAAEHNIVFGQVNLCRGRKREES